MSLVASCSAGTDTRTQWSVQTHDQLFNCKGNHILANEDSYTPDEDVDISTASSPFLFLLPLSFPWGQ